MSSEVSNPPTVMVVDDDVAVRGTIARYLGFEGFVVVEATRSLERRATRTDVVS